MSQKLLEFRRVVKGKTLLLAKFFQENLTLIFESSTLIVVQEFVEVILLN